MGPSKKSVAHDKKEIRLEIVSRYFVGIFQKMPFAEMHQNRSSKPVALRLRVKRVTHDCSRDPIFS
jgi:hypothetical protein